MILIQLLVVAWLPGAVLLRVPLADRDRRAALPSDERVFWAIVLSVTWSLAVVFALAYVGEYAFERLLAVNVALTLLPILIWRGRLRYVERAEPPAWSALVPMGIVVLGAYLFSPPAEYVMGGKDPGVYLNAGIQIAQRGSLVIGDPVVASVPPPARDLFFPSHRSSTYYGSRFMGFFIQNPNGGEVIAQFPHLFPASIAIGYGLNGLSGARQTVAFWATLGLLAVYFVARSVLSPAEAAAAVVLLGINVIEIWFGRYPNAEVVMQALLGAAMLAFTRAAHGAYRFFGPIAGLLVALLLFLRYDAVVAIGMFAAAATLLAFNRQRIGLLFMLALVATSALALAYLSGPMRAYSERLFGYTRDQGGWWIVAAAVVVSAACRRSARSDWWARRVRGLVPGIVAAVVVALAAYAYFVRAPGARLAPHDASAFRTFSWYLTSPGLLAATVGVAFLIAQRFWAAPAFFLTTTAYSVFFFYKARIVPEHFWMERRFLAATLPLAMIGLSAMPSIFGSVVAWIGRDTRFAPAARYAARALAWGLVAAVGVAFWRASAPVRGHIEYEGLIPKLETLASAFGDGDLVLVESRNASDVHVLALPLAYIYDRNVLVLDTPRPEKATLETFIAWAKQNYSGVYFLGGGGTDLLTRGLSAEPVISDRFQIPEYDSPIEAYPAGVRRKEFDYGVYRLVPARTPYDNPVSLQIGVLDDLNVVRFHAKERRDDDLQFRWSRDVSYIVFRGFSSEVSEVVIWMSNGGRPASAAPALVEVSLEDHILGTATLVNDVRPYRFAIAKEAAAAVAALVEPVRIRLRVPTWNPHAALGVPDTRDLGAMVTKVDVR